MESPVRICLGAALVVNLLLLSSTTVSGNAINDASTTIIKDAKPTPRYTKVNGTLVTRSRPKTPDVALNELNSKDLVSEEHAEQNPKYKDRGRVRFGQKRTKNDDSKIRANITRTSTVQTKDDIMIVTPTPPKKNVSQIIDSMRHYKKTKMPVSSGSSTTPVTVDQDNDSNESDSEDSNEFPKHSSGKDDNNFFAIPSSNEDSAEDSDKENTNDNEYRVTPLQSYSSYFPRASQKSKEKPTRSSYFHDFKEELTTPKNEHFDKRFRQISTSIMKNLASLKATAPTTTDANNHKIEKENIKMSTFNKDAPKNKSSLYIKNTKEIRVLDSEGAGSSKQELSDVQGTSVYYEMSVLSTDTYGVDNSNDDDCEDDSKNELSSTTAVNEDVVTIKPTSPTVASRPTNNRYRVKEFVTTVIAPVTSSDVSTSQNSILATEKNSIRYYTSTYSRNTHSKRLNFTGSKVSNSVTPPADQVGSNQVLRPTRRFHSTTPKTKLWMAPKRNVTRGFSRGTVPTTIYSEYFEIQEKNTTTARPRMPNRQSLTTVPSDIDPVLQSEIGGAKKVVQSQSLSDNSIPTLWKRGSTKYSASSTVSSTEVSNSGDMEIPPTAWALASLRSPPSLASPLNRTVSSQKIDDENELQKVGEVTESKPPATTTTPVATTTAAANDFTPKTFNEHSQFPWRQVYVPQTTTSTENNAVPTTTESKSESLPAESNNVSVQSSAQPATTEAVKKFEFEFVTESRTTVKNEISAAEVIGITIPPKVLLNTTVNVALQQLKDSENVALPPTVSSSKTTRFESITKFPSGITTPEGDIRVKSEKPETITSPSTTDFDITTIRFSYVPSEESTEIVKEEITTAESWHPVVPTKTNPTTVEDAPITTYRPQYMTTTEIMEESTTDVQTTQAISETSPKPSEEITEIPSKPDEEMTDQLTEAMTTEPETTTYRKEQEQTTVDSTTKMIVDAVTEISTEKETPQNDMTSKTPDSTESITDSPPKIQSNESMSEENSGSNEVITIETTRITTTSATTPAMTTKYETPELVTTEVVDLTTHEEVKEQTTSEESSHSNEISGGSEEPDDTTVETSTKSAEMEDAGEVTTEASSRVLTTEEAGSGAAVAIAVSTIGVIALILLVGLLLVVRRRGRRGVYAQRCTPVSLDAYSLDSVSVGHRKGNQRLRASKRSYGNPAYDDEVTSHPMQYAALANFALDIESMTAEFAEIPSVTVRPDEVPPGCEDKNRYSNVLPLPETRVPLMRLGSDPSTEYINANYVTGPGNIKNYYIACQAPLQHTVEDMWRMIWEQNSRLIVMLTEYMENGVEKCYEYLPPSEVSDNRRTFGDFQIILKKREQRDKYAISTVQLINLRTRTWREVTHMWYFWPAKGVPDDYDSIIDFLSEMRGYMKMSQTAKEYDEDGVEVIYGDQSRASFNSLSKLRDDGTNGHGLNVYSPAKAEELLRRSHANNGTLGRMKAASEVEGVRPCVVVCASGAGRAAALIALDVCARALAAGAADVPRVVRELRAQRPHSLANRHHYIFVYKVLAEYGKKLMGVGVDTI